MHHVWAGSPAPFVGRHYQLAEPLNAPPPLSSPRPPILIGGGGERRTLRLVAQYGDACNLFARLPAAQLAHKLEVLQAHCAAVGRPYAEIEKTALTQWNVARKTPATILAECRALRELGFDTVIASLNGVDTLAPIDVIAREVLPELATL